MYVCVCVYSLFHTNLQTDTHFTSLTSPGLLLIDWQVWAVTMGTRMEVAQLESRMNAEDYRKLQNLFLVSLWFQVSLLTALYYSTFISHLKNRVKLFLSNFDSIEPYL